MSLSAEQQPQSAPTYSIEARRELLDPPYPEDEYLPRPKDLTDRVCEAVPAEGTFEPLSFDPSEAWKLITNSIGGNSDIDGHFELTIWEHPMWGRAGVLSPKGEATYIGFFDGTQIHVGSRYIAYLRLTLAIDERDHPPQISSIRRDNFIDKLENINARSSRERVLKKYVNSWSDKYPQATIIQVVEAITDELYFTPHRTERCIEYAVEQTETVDTIYGAHTYTKRNELGELDQFEVSDSADH